ncbi:MAG: LysR family transcriptional regulator [Rhodobacteraceae bacterium]|nr:LysR family transcriptional regulator [Paracoccaceae bacterium]
MDWRNLPSLGALRAFAALAESGSFTAAGAALNVSHAAISQQVRALEERLGAALVVRGGRRLELTPEGVRLAAALDAAFLGIRRAVDELTGADAARPLRVTLTPAFAHAWLMPRLSEFLHENPGIELMLSPTAEVVELAPGGVDLAIRFGRGAWPGLDAELLIPSGFVVVGAPALVRGRTISTVSDLLDLPWLQELGTSEMSAWLREQGIEAPPREAITHLPGHLVVEALRSGIGVSVAGSAVVEADLREGRLVVLFEEPPPADGAWTGYYIVTRPGVLRPQLKAFVAWLRRHARRAVAAA